MVISVMIMNQPKPAPNKRRNERHDKIESVHLNYIEEA